MESGALAFIKNHTLCTCRATRKINWKGRLYCVLHLLNIYVGLEFGTCLEIIT